MKTILSSWVIQNQVTGLDLACGLKFANPRFWTLDYFLYIRYLL